MWPSPSHDLVKSSVNLLQSNFSSWGCSTLSCSKLSDVLVPDPQRCIHVLVNYIPSMPSFNSSINANTSPAWKALGERLPLTIFSYSTPLNHHAFVLKTHEVTIVFPLNPMKSQLFFPLNPMKSPWFPSQSDEFMSAPAPLVGLPPLQPRLHPGSSPKLE